MSIDDLQRRFDGAKTAIDLQPGSIDHVKHRAARRTGRTRVLSVGAVAVVLIVGLLALLPLRTDEPGLELVIAGPVTETVTAPAATGVIFETDFSQDTGYQVGFTNLWNGAGASPPAGWDGVIVGGTDGEFAVIDGEGIDDSNALRISWGGQDQPGMSLAKHLTGDEATGYDELYIRYRVRFPNSLTLGAGDGLLGSWKWVGLWQNTAVSNSEGSGWTENRANSGYMSATFSNGIPFTSTRGSWAENTGDGMEFGGSGGPRQEIDWFVPGSEPSTQPGYFERLWDINTTDRPGELENNTDQGWHTVEYRFGLASTPTADDGVFEVFFDGEPQGSWTTITAAGGAPERTGIPTANMGSGFNFLTFFGHVQQWNAQWADPAVDGFIWVNDVVVSAEPIGADYQPNN